jgi:tetratricopeptide (TPR) repeat protein
MNISRAIELNKRAFALAEQADDVHLQLKVLETELLIAQQCHNPDWLIEVVQKARNIPGFILMGPREHTWLQHEAWAHLWKGNLSQALDLCMQVEAQLTSAGMEGSDRYLTILDLRADVHRLKSEYVEARQLLAEICKKTSPACSPGYHAYALCCMAEMDILMEGNITDIISNLNAAQAICMARGSRRILMYSRVAAELELYRGDIESGRASYLECLSKSRRIYPELARNCLAALADPLHKMYGPVDTFRWTVVYLASMQIGKEPAGRLEALRRLADVYISMDDDETALHLFQAALKGGTKMGIHRLRAECMVGIGDIMLQRGDPMQAREMWVAVHPLFVRSSRKKDAGLVEQRLEKLSQSLLVIQDAAAETLTTSAKVVLASSLEKLETLSAPNISPSMKVGIQEDAMTSTMENTKLLSCSQVK